MKNFLLIDTSTDNLIAAVVKCGKQYVTAIADNRGKTEERLCTEVQNLLSRAEMTFSDVDAFVCAVGPGSFTGIRIGVATVKGYAFATGKPTIPYCNLEMLCSGSGKAAIDAGNGWYYAEYDCGKEVVSPCLIPYDQLPEGAATYTDVETHVAAALDIARRKAESESFAELKPIYIRKSQAEEKRDGSKT